MTWLRTALTLAIIPFFVACTTPTKAPPVVDRQAAGEARQNAAQRLFAQGDYAAAAAAFAEQARASSGERAVDLTLRAAKSWLRAARPEQAEALLASIAPDSLRGLPGLRERLLRAELLLPKRRPYALLNGLGQLPANTPMPLQRRYHELRVAAYTQAGNHLEAARERIRLDVFLTDEAEARQNHEAIWALLDQLHPVILDETRPPPPSSLGGWMELVLLSKRFAADTDSLQQAMQVWKQRYPGHPAQLEIGADIEASATPVTNIATEHIALLLPFSGRFAQVAESIRNGFLSAWYADGENAPLVSMYDTNAGNAIARYQEAVDAGASVIIGPLEKTAIENLLTISPLPRPTIFLNRVATGTLSAEELVNVYQFGLSPEDEAEQVASRAWLDGHTRALLLAPDSAWGKRVANAFSNAWRNQGGVIASQSAYGSKATNYARAVEQLLNVNKRKQRLRHLKDRLGNGKIKMEIRRRQDADFAFLAAFPKEGRLIRPQFDFYAAADLPIYSTSHIYTGKPDAVRDKDLNRITFGDMPWLLEPDSAPLLHKRVADNWPQAQGAQARFYAFGIDCYRVLPHLQRLSRHRFAYFPGATGRLQTDQDRRFNRRLSWATFRRGVPQLQTGENRLQ